eukprot:TRINITY_DN25547_c0_g1_i1.p1 TRINITY_DN25547_c0_g1~~TRINITY_DN25547_c0_g1_i1.p1  ORF type:complete len:355 (+),score=94.45 TRINITY_DN25547_c0_g1_i1:81-1145(+)
MRRTPSDVMRQEEEVLGAFKASCIDYLTRLVIAGDIAEEDVLKGLVRVEEERMIMPELVRMEMFADDVRRISATSIPSGAEALKVLQAKVKRTQGALARERVVLSETESHSTTTDYRTDPSSAVNGASSSDTEEDEPIDEERTVHLNPSLRITPEEYECWLNLCKSLRRTRMLTAGDAPRKLLLLMSSLFSSQIAIEAHDALYRLYREFRDEWFDRQAFVALRRITRRALAELGIRNGMAEERHSIRKMRLKQRRKVYKERKRVWDDERRGREGLEEEFGHGLDDYRSAMSTAMPPTSPSSDPLGADPEWFQALLTEHYASLEEQFARTLLERQYADLTARMAAQNPRPVSVAR